jgi:putative DNA primase/helicase
MQAIDKVLDACRRACGDEGKKSGREWRFRHPCSDEKGDRRSLAITEQADGTVLIHSHKPGYSVADVVERIGLKLSDLFPQNDRRGERKMRDGGVCTHGYEYTDSLGKPIARVNRIMLEGGDKSFMQGRYEGESYKPGLNGISLPLYLLPYVEQAKSKGETIYIVEGEKDARSMWAAGFPATTKAGGAKSKWTPENVESLRGASVIIVADADKPGREAAQLAYTALKGIAKSLRIVESAAGKDATDHLNAGLSPEEFIERDDLIPEEPGLGIVHLNGVFEPVEVNYLWEPYLPLGKGVLLDADGGTGKTTFGLALAAALSQGVLPNGGGNCEPARTIYLMGDNDTKEEMETVYRANGGVKEWISYHCGGFPMDSEHIELLRNDIKRTGAKLVVIDPFLYFLHGLVKDINDSVQVLPHCQAIGRLAAELNISILAIRHVPKSALATGGHFTGIGTVQFRNSFRGNLLMRKHPEMRGVVVITDDKGSLLVPTGEPLAYRRVGNEIQWLAEFENPFNKHSDPEVKQEVIEQWITANLGTDWESSKDFTHRATDAGFIGGSFNRAKRKLCDSKQQNRAWVIRLKDPFNDDEEAVASSVYRGGD